MAPPECPAEGALPLRAQAGVSHPIQLIYAAPGVTEFVDTAWRARMPGNTLITHCATPLRLMSITLPCPLNLIALSSTFSNASDMVFSSTYTDGKPLSSVLTFYFRDEVLPYYAGDDEAARDLAANDFKYWELMRRACARGLKVFDYGRSKQGTGPYAFKKNWGFEPTPLHYEYCLYRREAVPQNNPSNAKYQLMIKAWRRLPLSVANWLGPHIVRSLG